MAVVLTVMGGDERRTLRFERKVITLGRDGGNAIALDDRALSRTHCQFEREGDEVFVRGGLAHGERICVSPLESAVDGMSVRLPPSESPSLATPSSPDGTKS